jgi:hypothetical protein
MKAINHNAQIYKKKRSLIASASKKHPFGKKMLPIFAICIYLFEKYYYEGD